MEDECSESELALKDFRSLAVMLGIFYSLAVALWLLFDSLFYLANFSIIGTALGLGIGLWPVFSRENKHIARKMSQVLVGGYMFFGLGFGLIYSFFGFVGPENMQFEGFWFWLLAGSFAAAVLHYVIAKILGPFLFNRGWCGWACWTAAVLDFLPWDDSSGRLEGWGKLRYVHFAVSTALVFVLVFGFGYTLSSVSGVVDLSAGEGLLSIFNIPSFWWFFIGNAGYYGSGVLLAGVLKDNRAFCKYICPIACFLKIGSSRSILRIEGDSDECISCGFCDEACPMDIQVSKYVEEGIRVSSSECIICQNCVNACPQGVLETTDKFDMDHVEYLQYR